MVGIPGKVFLVNIALFMPFVPLASVPICLVIRGKRNYLRKAIVLSGRGLMSVNNVDRTKEACSKTAAGGYKCLRKPHPATLINFLLLPDSIFSI